MANALKRGPLVQLLKSFFTGTDVTTTSTTSSYTFTDVGNVVEGMQSYAQHRFSQLEHHVHGSSWLSHLLESMLVIGVATALVIVYRDDQKWAKIVSLFTVGTTTNTASEETKISPDLAVVGDFPGDMNEILSSWRARGFLVVSFAVIKDTRTQQDKYKIFLSLSSTLLHKLAVKHGIIPSSSGFSEETAIYGIQEKTSLCVRSIEVLRRSGIPFDNVILLHDRDGLNEVYGSLQSKNLSSFGSMYTWSNYLVCEYFGVKIAVCFAWMHAVYWFLLIPMCGLSLLTLWFRPPVNSHSPTTATTSASGITAITTTTTGIATATAGLALVACAFPVMSMVFLVWWEQRYRTMSFAMDKTGTLAEEEEHADEMIRHQRSHCGMEDTPDTPEVIAAREDKVWLTSLAAHVLTGGLVLALVFLAWLALLLQDLVYQPFTPQPFHLLNLVSYLLISGLNFLSHAPTVLFAVLVGLFSEPLDTLLSMLVSSVELSDQLKTSYRTTATAWRRFAVHFALKFSLPLLLLWRDISHGTGGHAHTSHSSNSVVVGGGGGGGSDGLARTRMAVYSLVFSDHIARILREYVILPSGLLQLLPPWLITMLHLQQNKTGGVNGGGAGVGGMSPSLQRFLLSLGPAILALLGGSEGGGGSSASAIGGTSPTKVERGVVRTIDVMENESHQVNVIPQSAGREGGMGESLSSGVDEMSSKEKGQVPDNANASGGTSAKTGSGSATSVVTAMVREEVINNSNTPVLTTTLTTSEVAVPDVTLFLATKGWKQFTDTTGKTYWGNERTNTSQWTLPLPEGWVEAVDAPTGQACYLYEPSGVVQLEYPPWDSPPSATPLAAASGAVGAGSVAGGRSPITHSMRGGYLNAQQLRHQQEQLQQNQQRQQRQQARGGPTVPPQQQLPPRQLFVSDSGPVLPPASHRASSGPSAHTTTHTSFSQIALQLTHHTSTTTTSGGGGGSANGSTSPSLSRLLREIDLPRFDPDQSCYLDMVLHYAFVILFSLSCPVVPLLSLLSCGALLTDQRMALYQASRPTPSARSSLQPWLYCCEAITLLSVITNAVYVPSLQGHYSTLLCGLLALRVGVTLLAAHLSRNYHLDMEKAREGIRARVLQTHERLATHGLTKPSVDSTTATPTSSSSLEIQTEKDRVSRLKMASLCDQSGWAMEPSFFIMLAMVPFVLNNMGIPWILTLPLAAGFCSYFSIKKSRRDRTLALSVTSMPDLMQLILKDLPGYVYDPNMQRVEWLNSLVNAIWTPVTNAVEVVLRQVISDALAANKPSIVSKLILHHCELGNRPIRIEALRVVQLNNNSTNLLILDVDVRWVSNMQISIVATTPIGTWPIQVAKLAFSGSLRVELGPVVEALNPFAAVSLTFMKKPYVDFSLQFKESNNGVDMLNMGVGKDPGFGVGKMANEAIHSAIEGVIVFPNWVRIPLLPEIDVNTLGAKPTGVLYVTIVSCSNLKIADFNSSDPYVIVSCGGEKKQTSTIKANLNPVFNAQFTFPVYEGSLVTQSVKLQVMDDDFGITHDDSLGTLTLPLHQLQPGVPLDEQYSLQEVNQGVIRVQMLLHMSSPPSGNTRGGGIRRNPRNNGSGGRGGPTPPRPSLPQHRASTGVGMGMGVGYIPSPPLSSSSSQRVTSAASPNNSTRSSTMSVGAEKSTAGGRDSGYTYNGGDYQPMGQHQSIGGQMGFMGGQFGLMGGPSEEDDDVLFLVDDLPDVSLASGKSSQGIVGIDKDGDGVTDDLLLFTWEG